jgi:F-type H+-transporting ATPase subunit epsilon
MADTIHLEIVTPEERVLSTDVESVQVPGYDGELGILPGHSPLISQLMPAGLLSYVVGGVTTQLAIDDGFVEVMPDRVVILAESATRPDDVDVHRAIELRERAEKRLALAASDPSIDYKREIVDIQRAETRIKIAGKK